MIRILRIVGRMNVGGPARCVLNLAGALAGPEFETLVATGRSGIGEGDLAGELAAMGIPMERIGGMGRELSPARDFGALRAIRKLIATFRPHIVHTHTSKAGVLGRLAAIALRPAAGGRSAIGPPRLVHTFHGHVLDGYFGPWKSSLFREMERWLAARTDAIVAVSASVRQELIERHGVGRPEQYRIIPSGGVAPVASCNRSAGDALRAELGLGAGPVGGVVGRMVPVKGHDLLLAALGSILAEVAGLTILLVGDGPLRKKYEARADRLGVGAHLRFLGNRSDVARIMSALDFLLLPSRKEGLPTVLLEAAAAGVPIAASRIPGVTDLFENGSSALVFESESPPALARAAIRLGGDRALRQRLASAARRAAARVMTRDAVAAAHGDLYKRLCSRRNEVV